MKLLNSILAVLLVAQIGFSKVKAPNGDERSVNSTDFHFHSTKGSDFNESWYYQFVFDNGTKSFLNFSRAKIPTKGLKSGVDITFKNFNGKNYQVGREYPIERFKEDKGSHKLTIKSQKDLYFMNGLPKKGHHVYFKTKKNGGYLLDLKFTSAVIGKVIGDGKWKFDGEEDANYSHFIHTPYAKVEGVIAKGKDTLEVQGYAYMDHIVSSAMATEAVSKSYLFSSPGAHVAGRVGTVTKDYGSGHFGYAIIYRNEEFQTLSFESVSIGKKDTKLMGENFEEFDFKSHISQGCYSPLDNIDGSMAKWAAKQFLGGKIILCPGRAKSHLGTVDYLKFHVEN